MDRQLLEYIVMILDNLGLDCIEQCTNQTTIEFDKNESIVDQ